MHFLQAIGAHSMAAATIWSENNPSRSCLALVGSRSFSPPPARGCLSTRLYRRIHPRMFASSPPTYVVLCRLFFTSNGNGSSLSTFPEKREIKGTFGRTPAAAQTQSFRKLAPAVFHFRNSFELEKLFSHLVLCQLLPVVILHVLV